MYYSSSIPKVKIQMAGIVFEQNETLQRVNSMQNYLEQMQLITSQASEIQPQLNNLETALQIHQRAPEVPRPSHINVPRNSGPVIRVTNPVHRQQTCQTLCMCRCHRRATLASPSWMQHLIGSLFIGYTALPTPTRPICNEKRCMQRQNWLVAVSYYFPLWILIRAIFPRARSSPMDGCMVSIRTPLVISNTAPQYIAIQHDNMVGLQTLFGQGLASPFDVVGNSGQAILQVGGCDAPRYLRPYTNTLFRTGPTNACPRIRRGIF